MFRYLINAENASHLQLELLFPFPATKRLEGMESNHYHNCINNDPIMLDSVLVLPLSI
jgi:hypothetical protein